MFESIANIAKIRDTAVKKMDDMNFFPIKWKHIWKTGLKAKLIRLGSDFTNQLEVSWDSQLVQ